MHYKVVIMAVLASFSLLTEQLIILLGLDSRFISVQVLIAFIITSLLSLVPTIASSQSNNTNSGIDPTILVALIGLGGAIVVALIGGGFLIFQTVYQARRNVQLQKENLETQHKYEQAMLHLQERSKAKEQEEHLKTVEAENARIAMALARSIEDRVKAYRAALKADPRIAHLQILDMSRPLEVTNVYVRVRVHQETISSYELDKALVEAEKQRDPNALLRASQKRLERRVSSALDPDEAIRTFTRCVIVGDPGAGKTTLLKYLALKAIDGQLAGLPDLPIHIDLNAFANSTDHNLLDFASTVWEEKYGFPREEARAYMEDIMKNGKALLLLDALDETVIGERVETAEASYESVTQAVTYIATRYHKVPIVVTVRKAGYHQRAPLIGFTELEVVDFRLDDIKQFVNNWFNCYHDLQKQANAIDLNAKLEVNLRIQALASNPLLLSLIVLVYEAQLDLPERRAELYKRCVDTLLTEWDAKRNIRRRREFKPEHKRQLLEEIAWHFHIQGRRYFPEIDLLKIITDFLPAVHLPSEQSSQILEEIANENGLLKEQARGWHGFLHLTLQEYFVAQYVADHNQLDTILAHRGDPWWEEVLLLYAGHIPDVSILLQKLLEKDSDATLKEDLFCTNLVLAGRCVAARPTIRQVSLREEVTSRLFNMLVVTPYSLAREHIANSLAEVGGIEVNTHLLSLLFDLQTDKHVRQSIAEALGRLGERSTAQELLHLLCKKGIDEQLRQSIAEALGRLGERSIAPDLVSLLSDQNLTISMRESIAACLGTLGERSIAPDLVSLLSDQQINVYVRESIAASLGILGERSVVPNLLRLLYDQQVQLAVYRSIVSALGRLGDRSVVPDLLHLLSNESVHLNVRKAAAEALGRLGDRSVVPNLLHLISDRQIDKNMYGVVVVALSKLGERSATPKLLHLLSNQSIEKAILIDIAEALGVSGEQAMSRGLLKLLLNEDTYEYTYQNVTAAIATAIGMLGEKSIAFDLLKALSNQQLEQNKRQNVAETLGRLGERSVIPSLLSLLANQNIGQNVRHAIVVSIGQLANDEPTACALADLLQTSDIADVIHRALWTVSRQAGVRIIPIEELPSPKLKIVKW